MTTKILPLTTLTGSAPLLTLNANQYASGLFAILPAKFAPFIFASTLATKTLLANRVTWKIRIPSCWHSIAVPASLKSPPTVLRLRAHTLTVRKKIQTMFAGSRNALISVNCTTAPYGTSRKKSGTAKPVRMKAGCPISAFKTLFKVLKTLLRLTKTPSTKCLTRFAKQTIPIARMVRKITMISWRVQCLNRRKSKEPSRFRKWVMQLLCKRSVDSTCSWRISSPTTLTFFSVHQLRRWLQV